MSTDPRTYRVHATSTAGGIANATVKAGTIAFDAAPGQSQTLPGPADLLTASFAACVLKNVERFSRILPFRYQQADLEVSARRQDSPPRIMTVVYTLRVVTDEPAQRLHLLHTNIRRHGTIYNTLAAVCEVSGDILSVAPNEAVDPTHAHATTEPTTRDPSGRVHRARPPMLDGRRHWHGNATGQIMATDAGRRSGVAHVEIFRMDV